MAAGLCVFALCVQGAFASPDVKTFQAQKHAERGVQFEQTGDLKRAEAEFRQAIELVPNSSLYLSQLGTVLGMQQKLEEALPYLEKSLKIDPDNLVIRRNLVWTQWQLGRFPGAKENLDQILAVKPDDQSSILLLGMVAEKLKDYERAAKLLESVDVLVKQRPESIAILARSYYHTDRGEKARRLLDTLRGFSNDPSGVFAGGQVAAEANDYETAERLFSSIRPTYPNATRLGYAIARVQYRASRFNECQKTLLELIDTGRSNSEIYNLLGWNYQAQNELKKAIQAFEHAIDLAPTKESNYLDLSKVLARNNLLPAALMVVKRAVDILPDCYSAYVMMGMIEITLDRHLDAVASFTRAAKIDPSGREANVGLAISQSEGGMIEEARTTFERGIERFPNDAMHYREYALMLLKLAERGDASAESRAVSLFEKSIVLDGSLAEPYYQIGKLALTRGNVQEALQHFETAAKLEPKRSKIHHALARAYARLGRKEEASREQSLFLTLKVKEDQSNPRFATLMSAADR